MKKELSIKLDLIKSFIQFDQKYKILSTTYNYDNKNGVSFSGYKTPESSATFVLTSNQVELIDKCDNIKDIYNIYIRIYYLSSQPF